METLLQAKTYVFENRDSGVYCPCCGQLAKRYRRKMNSSMALVLIEIAKVNRKNDGDFFHVENHLKNSRLPAAARADFHKLRLWRFLEAKPDVRDDGSNRNGFYRITGIGKLFVDNAIKAPSHVFIYNNEVEGFSESVISITEALGERFNYNELMRGNLCEE